jgi:hypothetical protein
MSYTKGTYESLIDAIKSRLYSYTANGQSLEGIKQVLVGSRPVTDGTQLMPLILIRPVSYQQEAITQANAAGTNRGIMTVEIKLLVQKLQEDSGSRYAENTLFDGQGNGAMAYWQWLMDAMSETTAASWSPDFDLRLDSVPDVSFGVEEFQDHIEIMTNFDFSVRYTWGAMSGNYS